MSKRRQRYPWRHWLGKPQVVIRQGLDYTVSQASMAQMIRNNASRRGMSVNLEYSGDTIVIRTVESEALENSK